MEETVSKKAQDIWQVIRVVRNPFNTRCSMPQTLEEAYTDEDKVKAIVDYNFRGYQGEPPPPLQTLKRVKTLKDILVSQLRYALSKTNNNSTPGGDKVSYKLLKLLQNTRLGT